MKVLILLLAILVTGCATKGKPLSPCAGPCGPHISINQG